VARVSAAIYRWRPCQWVMLVMGSSYRHDDSPVQRIKACAIRGTQKYSPPHRHRICIQQWLFQYWWPLAEELLGRGGPHCGCSWRSRSRASWVTLVSPIQYLNLCVIPGVIDGHGIAGWDSRSGVSLWLGRGSQRRVEVNKAELMTRLKAAFQRQRHVVELPQGHALIGLWRAGRGW
jgi:hypothetical protein